MEILCTRPTCPRPENHFPDLNNRNTLTTVQQKFCVACGMPLIVSGRYLPERLLGKGGFGAAFLARDRYTPTMRPCVVKLFQPAGDLSPDQLEIAQALFQREATVLEDLGNRHPQIPDLYAFFPLIVPAQQPGEQEEYFYLVQEFIDGEDFEQILEREGALPSAEVIELLVSMLKVLDFVHSNGSIHRDIKPSNIMRDRSGKLYLLDFGAVKQVTAAQSPPSGKSTGIYSVGFAPPEQIAGGEVYPSTDLYSLAVTCISLLTGKDAGNLYSSYSHEWTWKPHAKVNPEIAAVLDRMLLPIPKQRYASAPEVLEALKWAVQGASSPQGATPPGKSTTLQPPQPPQPPPVPPVAVPPPPIARQPQASIASLSLAEFFGGAAFLGAEAGLLAIALVSLLGTTWLGSGAWLLLVLGLLLLQVRRVIERVDLVIIAGLTLALVLLFPPLQSVVAAAASPRMVVVAVAILAGLAAVSIATLFRLIYRVLSTLM